MIVRMSKFLQRLCLNVLYNFDKRNKIVFKSVSNTKYFSKIVLSVHIGTSLFKYCIIILYKVNILYKVKNVN